VKKRRNGKKGKNAEKQVKWRKERSDKKQECEVYRKWERSK